jgi:competence protein ComEC
VFTLPLSLYYFSQTSNWFFITNLLVIPLAFLLMISALMLLTIGWLPGIEKVTAYLTELVATGMNGSVEWVEHLPHSVTYATMTPATLAGMYMIIFLFVKLLKRVTG